MRWPTAWGAACCWSLSTTLSTAHFIPAYMHNHHITITIIVCKTCSGKNNNSADESLLLMRHRGPCRLLKMDLNISFTTLTNDFKFSKCEPAILSRTCPDFVCIHRNVCIDCRSNQGTMRTCTLKIWAWRRRWWPARDQWAALMKANIPSLPVNRVQQHLLCVL